MDRFSNVSDIEQSNSFFRVIMTENGFSLILSGFQLNLICFDHYR